MARYSPKHLKDLGLTAGELEGLDKDEREAVIKRAYRKAALATHPDQNPNDPLALELFKLVNDAYEALTGAPQEIEFTFRSSASAAWDGSTGIVKTLGPEELAAKLKSEFERRLYTVRQVRRELDEYIEKVRAVKLNILSAAGQVSLSEEARRYYQLLDRIEDAHPKMVKILDEKLKPMLDGSVYDGMDDEGRINMKGTMLNFFYASKELKGLIFEIEKVIPGVAGGLRRLTSDATAEVERLLREAPRQLPGVHHG